MTPEMISSDKLRIVETIDAPNKSNGDYKQADLTFKFVGDAPSAPPKQLLKGLLPAEGIVVTGGQSTAGKTFIEIHKAVCLAQALPFFGYKAVEKIGTVFIAAEGRAAIPNRFAAALKQTQTHYLPICWPENSLPDFSNSEGVKSFIKKLKAIDERMRGDFGVRLGQITIDTAAACFAMRDEDDNAEVQRICNTMRGIGNEIGALMTPIHHYGKNPESGLRGASAWKGSADVIIGALADIDPLSGRTSNRELVCAKARDGEQGPISPFELKFAELGSDDDGEIYGSCFVVPLSAEHSRFEPKISKGQRAIQAAIDEVMDGRAKMIVPRAGMPPVKAVKVADVRTDFDRRYVVDDSNKASAAEAKRKAFKRALDQLSPFKFSAGSAEGSDWVWRVAT